METVTTEIQAKELKLGNWVTHKIEGDMQIDLSDFEHIHLHQAAITEYLPIELTTEWLTRFGFDEINGWTRFGIAIDMDGTYLCLDCDEEENVFTTVSLYDVDENMAVYLRPLTYVHELQNLFYSLSDEELKLK